MNISKVQKYLRGQIWWYESAKTYDGNIQGKTRPVIIMSNDIANRNSQNLLAIPCTSQIKAMHLPTHIDFKIGSTDNVALCESLISINIMKIQGYVGTCNIELISRLEEGMKIALGLEPTDNINYRENLNLIEDNLGEQIENSSDIDIAVDTSLVEIADTVVKITKRRRPIKYDDNYVTRFLQDDYNHDTEYMIKKYDLKDSTDLAKKRYAFKKKLNLVGKD